MRCLAQTVALLLLLHTGTYAQTPGVAPEYQVKAAFLLNFGKFVTWPDSPDPGTATPFTVCVAGNDPFGSSLDDVLEGQTVKNRPVAIRRQGADASTLGCHLLFVGETQAPEVRELLGRLGDQGVLTVGEGDGFVKNGGIIGLTLKDKRVQFSVNLQQAERARLKLSAQLLNLATIVQPD